jgi:hypothetical protein
MRQEHLVALALRKLEVAEPFGDADSRSQGSPPHNLPPDFTSFVGREHELTDLRTLLENTSLLTLTGVGGAGKRLLRTLVADVTLTSQVAGDEISIGIRWRSGASEHILTRRPPPQCEAVRTPSTATQFIVERGPMLSNQELVTELNRAGFKTGMGRLFDINAVQWVRYAYHVPSPSVFHPGELSVAEVAARLGISTGAIYDWIACGYLTARRTRAAVCA